MFLTALKTEQKPHFLNLAQNMVSADGILKDDELAMMDQYKREMYVPMTEKEANCTAERSIELFAAAPVTVQKQVVFELVALAYADKEYAAEEEQLLRKIIAGFGLDVDFLKDCLTYVEELTAMYRRIEKLVDLISD